MSERVWTAAQQQAIKQRGQNLLVSAGAGAGKTAVLVERILRMIQNGERPLDIDRLLVVTYTNAAAAGMRERLGQAIMAAAAQNPENTHLHRQMLLLQRAQVCTLHAFCLDVIRRYFYLLDIDPQMRIAQQTEVALLQQRLLDDLFEEYYQAEDSPLKLLLQHYNRGVSDDKLRALLLEAAEKSYSMPQPQVWAADLAKPYAKGKSEEWLRLLIDELQQELAALLQTMEQALALAKDKALGLDLYQEQAERESEALAAVVAAQETSWREFCRRVNSLEFGRLAGIKATDGCDQVAKERFQTLRRQVTDGVRKLQKELTHTDKAAFDSELAQLFPVAQAFSTLLLDYLQRWQQVKKQNQILEFADLEHYTLQVLQNEEARLDLQQQFDEIMVDEYQDVNEVQEGILQALSGGNNCVMVGDIKQSIYRFRMAEPNLFLGKYHAFAEQQGGKRIDLNNNFRSQAQIIEGVNFLFRQLMGGGPMEINYDDDAALNAANLTHQPRPIELLLIDEKAQDEAEEDLYAAQKEGRVIAEKMLALHTEQGISYGEMVVLMRSKANFLPLLQQQLELAGVPCVAEGGESLYDTAEVIAIIALLRVLDNPWQDIELAAVLHSPLGGFSLAELAALRLLAPTEPLYAALPLAQGDKARKAFSLLTAMRKRVSEVCISQLIQEIYDESGYFDLCGALADGVARQQHLRQFVQVAREYEATQYNGLYRFLHFIEQAAQQHEAPTLAAAVAESVRLMSIHQSKGLEFPVVFVAGLGRRFNLTDTRGDMLLHRHLGLGLRVVDLQQGITYPALSHRIIARQMLWEARAEELRVLYVALTRAEQQLILVGTAANLPRMLQQADTALDVAAEPLPRTFLARGDCYLQWLLTALMRHADGLRLPDCPFVPTQDWQRVGHFQIEVLDKMPVIGQDDEQQTVPRLTFPELQARDKVQALAVADDVRQVVFWQYAGQAETQIPAKQSVTQLQQAATAQQAAWQPSFSTEISSAQPPVSLAQQRLYAQAGTAIHSCLEHLDLQSAEPLAQVEAQLAQLGLPLEVAALIDARQIAAFVASPLGRQAAQAQRLHRELPFTLAIPASAGGVGVVQGVIDLLFWQQDGWVIVDYKSGANSHLSDAALRAKYGVQLGYYRQAVETILKQPVQAIYLYFLQGGRTVSLD